MVIKVINLTLKTSSSQRRLGPNLKRLLATTDFLVKPGMTDGVLGVRSVIVDCGGVVTTGSGANTLSTDLTEALQIPIETVQGDAHAR